MFFKWLIFNSAFAFIVAYLIQFKDALNVLLHIDPTRVTLIIISFYILTSLYLGWFRDKSNFKAVRFIASSFTSIGLAGTVIGMMLLFYAASDVGTNVIEPLFHGMATVLITTLFGIVFYILLSYQVAFCFNRYGNDE